MRILLEAKADVNATMTVASRHSPLTIAALMGHIRVYELLLEHGADTIHEALPWSEEPFVTAGGSAERILSAKLRDAPSLSA